MRDERRAARPAAGGWTRGPSRLRGRRALLEEARDQRQQESEDSARCDVSALAHVRDGVDLAAEEAAERASRAAEDGVEQRPEALRLVEHAGEVPAGDPADDRNDPVHGMSSSRSPKYRADGPRSAFR